MVDDQAQLYTIEGVAAGILMIITAYLIVSSTTVLTPQDVHIVDMQLEQLGSDAVSMLDTPDQYVWNSSEIANKSMLQIQIEENWGQAFGENFSQLINSKVDPSNQDNLKFNATIFFRNESTGETHERKFNGSIYYRENAVKVNRWVHVNPNSGHPFLNSRNQTVLLEVLLWRG